MSQPIDPTEGDLPEETTETIDETNAGAQVFFMQVIELFKNGNTEITVDYHKKDGEAGKIKMTLEAVE